MNPTSLYKEIGSKKFRPVYFFFGEEDYRKIEAYKYILNNFLPGKQKLLGLTKLSAGKTDLETIIGELASIPMLGERRLIFIEDVQKLKPPQHKRLFEYLKNPVPEMTVILSVPGSYRLDKKSAFYKGAIKAAEPVLFARLRADSMRGRIIRQFESAGFTWDNDAVELLISLTDGNFGGMMGELEKLSLTSGENSHIGIEQIKNFSSSYEEYGIFELIDLIADKKSDKALLAYNDLLKKGSSPAGLLVMLSRHIMNLAKIHSGKKMNGHPFFIQKLRKQARDFDEEVTKKAIKGIAEADRDIRHGKMNPGLLVENLIREISR